MFVLLEIRKVPIYYNPVLKGDILKKGTSPQAGSVSES
jgi:hypothetical protein